MHIFKKKIKQLSEFIAMYKFPISLFLFYLISIVYFKSWYHADEHYQIYEYVFWKKNPQIYVPLTWEFDYKIRATLLPTILYIFYSAYQFLGGEDPFVFAYIIRILTTLFSLYSIYRLNQTIIHIVPDFFKKKFLFLSYFSYIVIYHFIRFTPELLSGLMIVWAYIIFHKKTAQQFAYLLIGILLGLSFVIRIQNIFMILGFVAWLFFVKKIKIKSLFYILMGGLLILFLSILIDRWFYGQWIFVPYRYYFVNLELKIANEFGVMPWWYFIVYSFLFLTPIYGLLSFISILLLLKYQYKNFIIWIVLPNFIFLSFISHKEIRFLIPSIFWLPLLCSEGLLLIKNKKIVVLEALKKYSKTIWIFFLICNFAYFVVLFFSKPPSLYILKYIYENLKNEKNIIVYTETGAIKNHNAANQGYYLLNFYKTNNAEYYWKYKTTNVDSLIQNLKNESVMILECTLGEKMYQTAIANPNITYKIIYQHYPIFVVKYFNINNWYERAGNPTGLEIRKNKKLVNQTPS